jgi:hypothetical protein
MLDYIYISIYYVAEYAICNLDFCALNKDAFSSSVYTACNDEIYCG